MSREARSSPERGLSILWKVAPNPIFKAANEARRVFQSAAPPLVNWPYTRSLPITDREPPRFYNSPFEWKNSSLASPGSIKTAPKKSLLPPMRSDREFTLVLDLDELLVHYEADSRGGGRTHTRPHLKWFLQTVSEHFEIVVFATSPQNYCDLILDQIDSGKWISHRLNKNHLTSEDGTLKRDLSILGRDPNKIFSVTSSDSSKRNPLTIPAWFGDTRDRELKSLAETLSELLKKRCMDQ